MKKILIIGGIIIVLFGGSVWWSKNLQKNDPDVVARQGIHWHPQLSIFVKGEKQEVSPNIGITGGKMGSIHTHEPDGTIHFEYEGVVSKDDVRLKKFFEIWNKDINSFGQNVKMTVNGEENTELGDYPIRDGDKIELRYE